MTTKEKATHYKDAVRYMNNAAELLSTKAGKNGKFYEDVKYVRMACGTAYSGVLLALDTYLEFKGKAINKKQNSRKRVDDYRKALATLDKKMLNHFNIAYSILHIDGYYEGINKYDIIKSGIDSANEIINKIKPNK